MFSRQSNETQLITSLQRHGLSLAGIQQVRQGQIVSNPTDRAAIAKMIMTFANLPPAVLEVYDYPGEYAQRFDGVDKGGG